MIGAATISRFPSQWIRRPSAGASQPPTRTPSAFDAWFAARIRAPSRGSFPTASWRPSTRTRVKQRNPVRAKNAHIRTYQSASSRSSSWAVTCWRSPDRTRASRLADLGPRLGLSDLGDDELDGLIEPVAVRSQHDGVLGNAEWRDGTRAVDPVAPPQVGQNRLRVGMRGVEAPLLG